MMFKLSKSLYSKEVLLKTVYSVNDSIQVEENSDNYILDVKSDVFDFDKFNKQLQEQQLRETLNMQFWELRNAIYKKAFSIVEK